MPGFVLARSYGGKEQLGLGVIWRTGSQSPQGEPAHPPAHPCPLNSSPQVADSHTCVLGTLAVVSPGWDRGHRALGCEDEGGSGLVKGRRGPGRVSEGTKLHKGWTLTCDTCYPQNPQGAALSCVPTSEADYLTSSLCSCGSPSRPGKPDQCTHVLTRHFCSAVWGFQGWDRAKSGEKELAKGWKDG